LSTTTISVGISIQVVVRLRGDFDGEINLNGLQFGFHRGRDFYPTIVDSHFPSAISADQEIKTSRDGARVEKEIHNQVSLPVISLTCSPLQKAATSFLISP
jgi:hypothetical protein